MFRRRDDTVTTEKFDLSVGPVRLYIECQEEYLSDIVNSLLSEVMPVVERILTGAEAP